ADSHPMRIEAGRLPNGINGSLGVASTPFIATTAVTEADGTLCALPADQFGPAGALQITGRNAPPAVDSNSIHNFWDGRANFVFNGLDPTGEVRPGLYTETGMKSVMILESSQASQAVGPVNSDVEMAAVGRTFLDVGFKMCHVVPLCTQTGDIVEQVKADGNFVPGGYLQMIRDAFGAGPLAVFVSDLPAPGLTVKVCVDGAAAPELCPCTITEANFALFFGLAVQAYEQTLSTQPAQQPTRAMKRAFKEMRCDKCHYEDGRSHAVTGDVGNRPFSVTGVAPLAVDPGATVANLNLNSPFPNDEAEADAGFFKSTHLFNLPLTAPYFHDGSAATIKEMLDFYVRGGNHDLPDLNSHIRVLDATPAEQQLVIEMMEILTDPRIAAGTGPYAHPSLKLPLADGTFVEMRATDDPVALAEANPGLSYVHVTATGEIIGEAPAIGGGAAADGGAGAVDAGAGAVDAGAGAAEDKKKRRKKRNRKRRRSR
ncbi:MAG: hypothetical protein VXZ38_01370, partial [Planctomycetota bacterium]|nr:hypothetical protein [Planctomycetota bacterium]